MKLSLVGRWSMALFASLALGLGMTACGGGTIGYMYVLGQQYNQIAGFKVDDYTGNLTEIQGAPFSSNGTVPVSIVIKSGGRYVYVINQGTCPAPPPGSTATCGTIGTAINVGQTIAVYSVGGDGTLSFQNSYTTQGYVSEWAQMDTTGTYLYVLDKYSPKGDGNGSITAFTANATTGRLTLVTNSQTQVNGVNTNYWEVGPAPIMSKSLGGCLYTVNTGVNASGLQTVTPYTIGTGGQLVFTTTGNIQINQVAGAPTGITSINGSGEYVFLTDGANNILYGYESTTCSLTALNGGTTNLSGAGFFPNTSDPVYSMIDSTGKYLYIVDGSPANTQTTTPASTMPALTISPTNQELQAITGAPYTVGSGPVCIVEDPTNQYIYTSNHNDGTVTGKVLNSTNGQLSDLSKGSTFTATGLAGCLIVSGSVD